MDRLQQKTDLYVKLGMLFGPLQRIVEHPDQYDEQEQAETEARYFHEYQHLAQEFRQFSVGQPGHNYIRDFKQFHMALIGLRRMLSSGQPFADVVRKQFAIARAAIDAVPVPRTSVIVDAGSPFTAYCKLRELCEADATKSLVWIDEYFSDGLFHRYVRCIRANVHVTLVTCEPGPRASARDRNRWTAFLDVSRLYASEHGPAQYRLIAQPTLHDRWVAFDERRIYSLGGSAKDAADKDYYTITGVDPSAANVQRIRAHTTTGSEWFGPACTMHR